MKALLIVMGLGGVAGADPAAEVLANAQHYYAKADHLKATFQEVVTNPTFGNQQTSQGNIYIAKPALFRFDYIDKKARPQKLFVFDGKTGWFVDHANKAFYQQPVSSSALPAAVSFLTGGSALEKDFTVALDTSGAHGGKGATVLKLLPKQPSAAYKELYFVVEPSDGHVRESIVLASNGETSDFKFFSPDTKAPVSTTLFTFDPKSVPTYVEKKAP